MDDSQLVDIYEDLSVDKICKMSTQTLPVSYTKPEPDEEESKIDLFMEALAVHTIDKVQSQLSELQKENEKLRCENAELRESKKQLSKNISSLFITARQEIQKKEEEIAKLMLESVFHYLDAALTIIGISTDWSSYFIRKWMGIKKIYTLDTSIGGLPAFLGLQENCESCRLKQVQHDLKQPLESNWSSVNSKSTVGSKTDKPQSEIRNRLMQEISQSYSLSSCQGVASRKKQKSDVFEIQTVHNNSNNTVISEPEPRKTMTEELKSFEDRKVARSKQDSCIRNHHTTKYFSSTSDHQQPHATTSGLTTSKECKSLNLKNKPTMPDVETQRLVKIRKIEKPKSGLMKNSSTQGTEKINNTKHAEKRCSNEHEHLPYNESKIANFGFNPSLLSNSEPTVSGHAARKPKQFMFVGTSEPEMALSDTSNRLTWSHFQGTFVPTETSGNHSVKSSGQYTNSNGLMQFHTSQIYKAGTSIGLISSVDAVGAATFDEKGSANNYCQAEKLSYLKSDCSLTTDKTALLAKTSRRCTRNVQNTSVLKDSSHMVITTDNQAFLNGDDTASCTKFALSTRKRKKILDIDHDKNSNCSSKELPTSRGTPFDDNEQDDSIDKSLFAVDNSEPTYITCTSNLILLGDEETCTTISSPDKLQPSEFIPPGVRGTVHEGGSHARHIRGITKVIKKVPVGKRSYFQSEPNNVPLAYTDENIKIKTEDENNAKMSCLSNSLNCDKACDSGIMHSVGMKESLANKSKASNIGNFPEPALNSHICDCLEEIRTSKAEYTNASQKGCDTQHDWAGAVSDMFGTVFHKKLCTLKQKPPHPVLKNQSTPGIAIKKFVSGISIPLKNTLTKADKQIE